MIAAKKTFNVSRDEAFQAKADFIRAWWRAETFEQLIAELGIDRREASNEAAGLRRRGVILKPFRARNGCRRSEPLDRDDYKELQRIAVAERNALATNRMALADDTDQEADAEKRAAEFEAEAERIRKRYRGAI